MVGRETVDLAERVVAHEFAQFQLTRNDGGRAACQDDWPTFHQMRLAQFLTWTPGMLRSYEADLDHADAVGRNLVTEKYARMMASTEPERYRVELAPHLPELDPGLLPTIESVVARQVAWAREFRAAYPRLGRAMRLLTSSEDRIDDTSFETYLRGELLTYSPRTLALYADLVADLAARGENLTTRTLHWTVLLSGYEDLDEAEAAQE
ncbi:uncharacterized protein DUF4125 [Salana multivorans]|uniref:Uncharacterized protein DUF4125 n=1 Tax=Salana multivorans TaxID=120377 RepID=A0A3N2DAB2_9MICO|nr:DUF4125 family protein [Salana multivorans]MBN8882914.1 DUF4125 family protein [Salana multivorans]ROR96735.1 uncharacterized protein DUF4125 [Salana multivorans]